MLARKSGYAAPSAALRGRAPTTDREAAAADAPNASRKAPLKPSYRTAKGTKPRTYPPLAERDVPVISSAPPSASAAIEPAVDSPGEAKLNLGRQAVALAEASNSTAATHKTGSKSAPKAASGMTVTLRFYLEAGSLANSLTGESAEPIYFQNIKDCKITPTLD
jgi:hypothetical protein